LWAQARNGGDAVEIGRFALRVAFLVQNVK